MPATQREIDTFKNSLKMSDLDYGDQEKAAWNFMQQKLVSPEFEALPREQKQQAWINFRTDMIGEQGLMSRAGEAIEESAPKIGKKALGYTTLAANSAIRGMVNPFLHAIESAADATGQLTGAENLSVPFKAFRHSYLDEPIRSSLATIGEEPNIVPDIALTKGPEGFGVDASLRKPSEVIGETGEIAGFMIGPGKIAGGASRNIINEALARAAARKFSVKLTEVTPAMVEKIARPFFQALARGATTGVLLGEGDPEKTAANVLLFSAFEALPIVGERIAGRIQESSWWAKLTKQQRNLIIQDLGQTIEEMQSGGSSPRDILRTLREKYGKDSPEYAKAFDEFRDFYVFKEHAGPDVATEATPGEAGPVPATTTAPFESTTPETLSTARAPLDQGLPGPPGGTPTVFAESKQPRMSYNRQIPSGLVGEGVFTDEAATRTPVEPRDITPIPEDQGTPERLEAAKRSRAREGYFKTVEKLKAAAEGERQQLLESAKARAAREYGDSPAVSAALEDFSPAELRDYVEGPSRLAEKPGETPENIRAVPTALRDFIPSPHDFSYLEYGTPVLDTEGERTGARLPSTYPDYFQNQPTNLSGAQAKEALRKAHDGEPLSKRELEFVKHAAEKTRTAYKYTPEILEGSDIEIGDSVTIDGEPHVATRMEGTDIILKDHDVHRVNGFDGEIPIDRGSHKRGKPESVDELRTRLEREKDLSQGGIQLTLEGKEDLGGRPPQKGVADLPMFGGKLEQGTPGDALQRQREAEARQGGLFKQPLGPPNEGGPGKKKGGGGVVLGSGLGGMWDAIQTERGKVVDATTRVYTTEKERFADNLLNKLTHGEAIKTELGKAATGRDILSRHIGLQDLTENAAMVGRLKDREELGRAVGAIYKRRPAPFRFASAGTGKPTRYVDAADEAARIAVEIRRSESLDPDQKVHRESIPLSGVQDARWAIEELRKEGGLQNEDTARLIEFALEIHEGKHPNLTKYVNRIEAEMQQLGQDAMDSGLISSILAHYSPRYWIDPKGKRGKSYRARFATKSKHAQQRVFNSYFEGLRLGYRPRVRGLSNAKAELIKEHGNTLADRELISIARTMKDAEGRPFFSIDSHGGDYKELHHPNFHDYVPSFSINLKPFKEAISYAGQEAPYQRGIPKGLDYVESVNKPLYDQLVKLLADKDKGTKNTFITQHGDTVTVFEKRKLYAPRLWADHINAMYDPSAFFDPSKNAAWKLGGTIVKLSSYRKSLLFSGAFFHHKALAKSYLLGTRPWEKGGTIAPWKAAKEGYEMAMSMDPIIRLGIRNGLTLFKIPEWDKEILNRQRKLMASAKKAPFSAASKVMENFTDMLFMRFQTGLKAQAFALEYKHAVDKFQKKNNRPPTDAEADEIAKAAAQLINNDYGGLHWRRIGRSKTMLDLERGFIFLAPDWTESNLKVVPFVERVANHIFREGLLLAEGGQNTFGRGGGKAGGPKMDGMDKIYLKFLSGALAYGILATILANIALNGWDDTKKRFGKTAKEIKREGNLKEVLHSPAFAWDISKIYDHMGIKHQGSRVSLMPPQQFDDPVKLATDPIGFFRNKAAWAPGAIERLVSGRNWQDKPYLAWQEAWRTGHLTAPSKYNKTEGPAYYIPTVLFDEAMDVAPIPLRLMIDYQLGEVDGLTALLRESGEDVREEWTPRPEKPRRPYVWRQ